MAPSFQYIGLKQATTKVFDLGSSGIPPVGWQTVGFDDSGWPTSASPTSGLGVRVSPMGGGYGTANGLPGDTEPIAADAGAVDAFALRAHFTLPADPWQYYMLEEFIEGGSPASYPSSLFYGFQLVYLNGIQIQEWYQALPALVPGDNLFAFWSSDSGAGAWYSWRFTFWIPDTGGQAVAWGKITPGVNDTGVLGVGDTLTHLTPTPCDPALPANIVKIVSNGKHTLFLTGDGEIWECGQVSPSLQELVPRQVPVLVNSPFTNIFVDISIGNDCACALTREGAPLMWGTNAHGSFGRGNTISNGQPASNVTIENGFFTAATVRCGDDFTVAQGGIPLWLGAGYPGTSVSAVLVAAGGNEHGQIANGSSGSDVTSISAMFSEPGLVNYQLIGAFPFDAGDQRVVTQGATDTTLSNGEGHLFHGGGDGSTGSLGERAYPNTINTLLKKSILGSSPMTSFMQHGPITYYLDSTGEATGYPNAVLLVGDGVPYGGAGDGVGNVVYIPGTGSPVFQGQGYIHANSSGTPLQVAALAEAHSSHNPYSPGNSQICMAAVGTNGKLYTWGYGGFGQMGNGSIAATNLLPTANNGLTDVIGACVANQIMFAIGNTHPRGLSYANVIG